MRNLTKEQKDDWSVFLPSISTFYTIMLAKAMQPGYLPEGRVPAEFENGVNGLDFIDDVNGYFHYKWFLYSAGHATLDLEKFKTREPMIACRDKSRTVSVGDSGGFQIGKGVIQFDWEHFFEKEGDKNYIGAADRTRSTILNWLENTTEWSMTLDVPSWASKPGVREKTGLNSFEDCLKATLHNNDFFVKHRQGKTKFLNVLQGTKWEDSQIWYDAVKDYPFEGWAMGGNNIRDIRIALKRLIIMRDEGKLENKDWIHFLGTSKLEWACMLSMIQRQLRRHNPNLTISFDCASPFIASANGLVYTTPTFTANRFSYIMEKGIDNKCFKNNKTRYPFESEIADRLNMGDVCWYGPGDTNRIGKVGKTSWDSFSYNLLMAHNTYQHIRAVQRANALTDVECSVYQPNFRTWEKYKKSDKSAELSLWVPRNLLFFSTFVEELFKSEKPMTLLQDADAFLADFNNNVHKSSTNEQFAALFEHEVLNGDDSYSGDEDKLEELEKSTSEEI